MSKVICDVCGTSYPETADQCPICGCVRAANIDGVIPEADASESKSGYTYVKGGRFSKANVKKRNRAAQNNFVQEEAEEDYEQPQKETSNKGLVITALVLLVAIIAVIIYITVRFFGPSDLKTEAPAEETTETTAPQTTQTMDLSCVSITPVKNEITLTSLASGFLLEYSVEPANTEDSVKITSSDPAIVAVEQRDNNSCMITSVAPGEAYVIFECGDQRNECRVICDFEMPTEETSEVTEPTEETTPAYTQDDITFNTAYKDENGVAEVTLRKIGEVWRCYNGNIPLEEITWVSDDESVVTVENGVVTSTGVGTTTIHAIWEEYDVVCKVRSYDIVQEDGISGSGGGIGEG